MEKHRKEKAIYAFPGEVGQLLQEASPASLVRAEAFLPFILWRWYFLKLEQEPRTPYMMIDFYRKEEHWPKDGQFLPTAKCPNSVYARQFILLENNPRITS